MKRDVTPIRNTLRTLIAPLKYKLQKSWQTNWLKIGALIVIAIIISRKDFSFNFRLNANTPAVALTPDVQNLESPTLNTSMLEEGNRKPVSFNAASTHTARAKHKEAPVRKNVSPSSEEAAKIRRQLAYVKRFFKVAQAEMEKYGIPASITLAQGLLESQAGGSRLATKNRNHFGIKCFSKSCRKGHCSNFTDDSHKDFFRIYNTAWESYRAHSQLLQSNRYQPLYRFHKTDYRSWAHGLKKAGYATDKRYAEKLIKLIEELELYQYDR